MNRNLETIRAAIQEYQNTLETNKTIWNNIRKRTIRIRVQQYLFKVTHNTPMVGDVWFQIPEYEDQGTCSACGGTESMEHIIVGCTQGTANIIWRLARESWNHDTYKWPRICLGIALGCGSLTAIPHHADANPGNPHRLPTERKGATRLLQILISEATHLIWVLRCERVIQEKTHTPHETEAQWLKVINRRLTEDKLVATRIKRTKHHTRLIEATWEDLLKKNPNLPENWIQDCEVLVGRRAQRVMPIDDHAP